MLTGLLRSAHHLRFLLNDHSPTILTAAGVSGTVATAVLSGRAGFKAAKIIDREDRDITIANATRAVGEKHLVLTNGKKFRLTWKCFVPPVVVGAGTVTCVITANRISAGRVAALVAASGVSERAFQEYKDKVTAKFGERQERNARDEIAQDRVDRNPVKPGEVIVTGKGDVLFYDEHSGRYFYSTMETVKRAENKINHELLEGIGCSLSEFYEELGMRASNHSDSVGWNGRERMEVEFSTTLSDDSRPCIAMDFRPPPSTTYNRHTYG